MTERTTAPTDETGPNDDRIIRRLVIYKLFGRVMIGTLGLYLGLGLIYAQRAKLDITQIIKQFGLTALGFLVMIASVVYVFAEMFRFRRWRERQFIDVDRASASNTRLEAEIEQLHVELRNLRRQPSEVDESKIVDLVRDTVGTMPSEPTSFVGYYVQLKNVLEEKARNADAKASLLLDRGVGYSRFGIVLYILSIIAWQILAWFHGFQIQFIYGISSAAILFVFIEFLSAWFLRQYTHFVDTSTYLMKMKAIFDRYILTYLASADERLKTQPTEVQGGLLAILRDDVKWPDTYLLKQSDVGFARDVMESFASVATALRTAVKPDKKDSAA